ncbi:MAG TPA: phage tail protein, partial [Candidatus Limnocylindrales bacterium]|nr:phage tail protein [Candidatus Limnocylindrales bacterium]
MMAIAAPPPAATRSHRGSARGLVPLLKTPHPLGAMLPGLFQDDGFAQRMMAAFDEVLAPIFSTLDNLEAYFDPWLAPEDFLDWLSAWVGLPLDETWPVERRRAFVARAYDLFRLRGTVRGLRAHVE